MPYVTVNSKVKFITRGTPGPPGDMTSPFDYVLMNPLGGAAPDQEGAFTWNPEDKTLNINNGDIILQVGQEMVTKVVNKTGVAIPNGKAVSIVGAQGNRPTIVLADVATTSYNSFIGLTTHAIADNAEGFVNIVGLVRDVNTVAFTEGDVLYVGLTAGSIVNIKPVTGRILKVGICQVAHSSLGVILVNPVISFWTAEEEAAIRALIA